MIIFLRLTGCKLNRFLRRVLYNGRKATQPKQRSLCTFFLQSNLEKVLSKSLCAPKVSGVPFSHLRCCAYAHPFGYTHLRSPKGTPRAQKSFRTNLAPSRARTCNRRGNKSVVHVASPSGNEGVTNLSPSVNDLYATVAHKSPIFVHVRATEGMRVRATPKVREGMRVRATPVHVLGEANTTPKVLQIGPRRG